MLSLEIKQTKALRVFESIQRNKEEHSCNELK